MCLDIAKAYDKVDRGFLLAAIERLGLGVGFVAWCRLVLTATRARARVAGHLSSAAAFRAGVRHGCPLAPLLYLFVALLRLLKRHNFGVRAGGQRITALQFADDCNVLLEAPSLQGLETEVQRFLAVMDLFRRATGQALSVPKTVLLLLGALPSELQPAASPAAIVGIRVVGRPVCWASSFALAWRTRWWTGTRGCSVCAAATWASLAWACQVSGAISPATATPSASLFSKLSLLACRHRRP